MVSGWLWPWPFSLCLLIISGPVLSNEVSPLSYGSNVCDYAFGSGNAELLLAVSQTLHPKRVSQTLPFLLKVSAPPPCIMPQPLLSVTKTWNTGALTDLLLFYPHTASHLSPACPHLFSPGHGSGAHSGHSSEGYPNCFPPNLLFLCLLTSSSLHRLLEWAFHCSYKGSLLEQTALGSYI